MHDSPVFFPLREQHTKLRQARLSAVELAESALENFAARGEHDHAYLTWRGEAALKSAHAIDAVLSSGGDTGPLMGIPVSIKDIFAVPGMPTYAGSARRLPPHWEKAGPMVSALLRQLPSVMGKTHTVEFAFGGLGTNLHWGAPRNPWDIKNHRTPGGSSSGAGVSLVSGTAALALGTDTAGSVRIPASMTGVAALKTTAGRWPTQQIVPLSTTLDTPGLLARSVDDLAFAFTALDDELFGKGSRLPDTPDLADLTFGVPDTFFWDDCSPGIAEAVQEAIRQLEAAGARIVTLDLPRTDEAYQLFQLGGLAASELAAFLNTELPDMMDSLDPNVAARIKAADDIAAWEYVRRRNMIEALSASAAERLAHVDALLTPTVAITPPTLDSLVPEGAYPKANMHALRNTVMANFMGLCGLTLPVGKDAAGLPVGLQLLAGPWQDARLLAVGRAIEDKLGNSLAILGEPTMP
ncbi:amidase [Modicisalibacter luteus]|uniref:Amidase n=1 Tax=Modicisalibacter luteus TaxID=453962 RepID=A0ABV7M5P8_9GAMM|nr:amidase family protein [Halomonas lutea]GHA87980.1 amidase [Halomonas lutea]